MPLLPKEYSEFSDKITEILRRKPKKGYFENMVESGGHEPLDPLEEISSIIHIGHKNQAIQTLESALHDENKRELLPYVDDLEAKLQELIEELQALPDIDPTQVKASKGSQIQSIIAVSMVLTVVVTILLFSLL